MAFDPQSPNQIEVALATNDLSYRLAIMACGGQSASTDRVARIIRRELPPLMMRAVSIECARRAAEETMKQHRRALEEAIMEDDR